MLTNHSVLAVLGQNVRSARETKQLTQEKLAELASLDPTYISGIERGLRNPGIKNVAKIAKALGITTSELCKGVEA
jgi:transcriptional regulator with XRE-family HTH domain